ncbi:MAG: aldo/keto reductase [bacterium]|nr:aldo/keto reductase [bacterium]
MQYREFGNMGIRLSRLGFGAMRLPMKNSEQVDEEESIRIIHRAFELGVNYIDTAYMYNRGQSEIVVGKAVNSWKKGNIYVSTKNPKNNETGTVWRACLEEQLKKLNRDYIDIYHMHGINWKQFEENISKPGGPLDAAYRAKEEGLIHHLSFSFHDKPEMLIKLVDTGVFESVTVQYNLLDRSNESAIAYAHQKGLGVVVMGPVGGGRLAAPSEPIQNLIPGGFKSTAEAALRFVFANPNVDVAISGMNTIAMVEENCAVASRTDALSPEEQQRMRDMLEENKRLADLYCTGCGYCMPCPNEVNIPVNFRYMIYYRVYGLKDTAKNLYRKIGSTETWWVKGKNAAACVACGECEPKCPQKIPIIAQLKETAETLGE